MKKKGFFLLAMLLSIVFCGNVTDAKSPADVGSLDQMNVHFIDVGQGDATLITCGDSAMLIDAGENDKGTLVQNYLRNQGIQSLDYLIVTHPDSDHNGGADVIITKFDIDTVIMPDYEKETKSSRDVIKAMEYKSYKVTEPVVGDVYRLGDAQFTILAPNGDDYGDESNNYSVSILLDHGGKRFLFTGDAEEAAEKDILANKIKISADVYKVGHHGSSTSSSDKFLKAVNPEYAVISCGEDNEYGHPHAAVLNALRSSQVKVFRTDEQGSVLAVSDGIKITWNCPPSDTWQAGEATLSGTDKKAAEIQEKQIPKTSEAAYILNINTKKFHISSCSSVEEMKESNKKESNQSRDEIIAQGYAPCKRCNP